MDALRLQYLEALGVPVWERRAILLDGAPPEGDIREPALRDDAAQAGVAPEGRPSNAIRLGPGDGPGLCVCSGPGEASSRIASDIARALGAPPAWAWPDAGADALPVAAAVGERLFTSMVIFGHGLARTLFEGEPPLTCGPAQVVVAPSIEDMAASGAARRDAWRVLRSAGMLPER